MSEESEYHVHASVSLLDFFAAICGVLSLHQRQWLS